MTAVTSFGGFAAGADAEAGAGGEDTVAAAAALAAVSSGLAAGAGAEGAAGGAAATGGALPAPRARYSSRARYAVQTAKNRVLSESASSSRRMEELYARTGRASSYRRDRTPASSGAVAGRTEFVLHVEAFPWPPRLRSGWRLPPSGDPSVPGTAAAARRRLRRVLASDCSRNVRRPSGSSCFLRYSSAFSRMSVLRVSSSGHGAEPPLAALTGFAPAVAAGTLAFGGCSPALTAACTCGTRVSPVQPSRQTRAMPAPGREFRPVRCARVLRSARGASRARRSE